MEPWLAELEAGRHEAAWNTFLDQYRRLVFAVIRHYVRDPDDVMDAFTWVCEGLRRNDFRRLRGYVVDSPRRARFTTWLVTVVRHLCVDWLRRREGRPRASPADASLTPLQRRILAEVFDRHRSHAEAYEIIRSRDAPGLAFGRFLKELAEVYRAVSSRSGRLQRELAPPLPSDGWDGVSDVVATEETRRIVHGAMSALPRDDRLAVEMYVIDGLPAAEVARILGLPNAKAVYNRVYRALGAVREGLEGAGLGREDL